MKKYLLQGLILVCMLFAGLFIGHRTISVSKADESNVEYQKVMRHLEVIAAKTHPSGTIAIENVRQYLREVLDGLGCDYIEETFEAKGCSLTNILVTIDVPDSTDGMMLVSHYDSTYGGPGAADDGISVASMLVALEQSMYAFESGALKNDMYFLFTDGEEQRLLGATHFVNNHTDLQKHIRLVANFDARGNQGAMLMFQTSPNNNKLLRQLKRAVKNLDAFSVTARLYEEMPNYTDLTCFLNAGYPSCLDFAMIDGGETYHRSTDNVNNISHDSAYRYYETITDIAGYFGKSDLNVLVDDESGVFFPTIGGSVVILSSAFANISTVLVSVLALLWGILLAGRKRIHAVEMVKAFAVLVGSLLLAVLCHFVLGICKPTRETIDLLDKMNIWQAALVCLSVTALTMAVSRFVKSYQEYLLFAMMLCVVGGIVLLVWFDCFIYLVLIPLLILLVQSVTIFLLDKHRRARQIATWLFTGSMTVAMAVILYPFMKVVFDAFGNDFMLYFAIVEGFGVYMVNACFIGNHEFVYTL